MGNCFSEVTAGRAAIGGTAGDFRSLAGAPHDAVENFLRSRGHHGLFSQIELSFSASGLGDRDVLFKNNPMMVLYAKGKTGALEEICRTEVVLNSSSPTWITKHTLIYHFEVVQVLVFRVYDVDTQFHNLDIKMLELDEQQFLGEATCVLSQIITQRDQSLTIDLHIEDSLRSTLPKNCGKLLVHAEECVSSKTAIEMVFRCSDLECKDLFSRNDPFLLISKVAEGGVQIPICKTEVIKNDLNPIWKSVFVNIQQVGSKESILIIECYNYNSNGKHDLIGKVQRSLAELENIHNNGQGENLFLPSSGGQNHDNKVLRSQLFVDRFIESVQYTFLDYLAGGFELNFMVAVDFTASNGNPRLPDSLHYIDPSGRPNAYQRAIVEVGEVLQFYDSDKRFPTWGFGARPIDGPVSHCFNLNGSSHYCEVEGIQGIMMAYTSALHNVSLAGPTLFGPVISTAALIASQSVANGGRKYFVLLIITDGVVTDLQETKDAIVKASDLPLSILIVGVGGADFKEMEVLDADKGERLESSYGRVASRDIVQFVPFREVQSGFSVVQALLAELPTQFLTYVRSRDIQPSL
ncbi:protein BONZAI 1-like isoform X1 [Vigna unguiculata]|uniref:protein BONZAI 1-like isoform X1 n=2 Tax=Vigna unguiculata TaxID=3917 RepID=UPI001016E6CA|nr:protein BONZAI 1-like isoform X1 [Vigna unguiculata]XP_027902973.1 protein BONZAI 1-like isoform X1 [Vigna unguiculata]XP_027902975.1 protein BONZAI 1-like isoform X1 [Vigna unguiculata]